MKNQVYDIIYAGNYTKDTIITPRGTRHVDGGGMNYAAHAGKALGIRPAIVTRLSRKDHHVVDAIRTSGIDCFPFYSRFSTDMILEYTTDDVDKRNLYVTHTAGTIHPRFLKDMQAKAVVVSPSLRGEVHLDFFTSLRKRQGLLLSADVQGFVRVHKGGTLVYADWPEMPGVLAHLDILKSDAVEAHFLTGTRDIEKAAEFYCALGVKEVILTHSDGVLIHADGCNFHYAWHSQSQEGRSGRGDTCVGSYVAKRLSLPAKEAGKWAAAVTSLKVERLGVFNNPVREAEELIARYYGG